MQCPKCWNSMSWLATRCPSCTSEFTLGYLWKINVVGILLAVIVIYAIIKLLF